MAQNAVFLAETETGKPLMASAFVSDISEFERVAIHTVARGVGLHAFECGAEFGAAGRIWSQGTRGSGHLLQLGDASLPSAPLLQIYSHAFPNLRTEGEIALSLEAEVHPETCDHSVEGHILSARNGGLRVRELSLEMPDCNAVGDFLVLNNPVESLKLSRN